MSESTHAAYAEIDAVNWSTLKHMRDSALHYRYRLNVPTEDTPSMALGRAVHTLVFEPDLFDREYVIWEGGARRGKEWAEFRNEHEGRTIFKPDEIEAAAQIAEAVRRHPLVQPYLVGGTFEQSLVWTDQATGLRCKGRPDWLLHDREILIDLKSARSIEGRRFGVQAFRLGYHCALAHYCNGIEAVHGWRPRRVLIVAVENDAPYDVAVFELDEATLYAGHQEVEELLAALRACRTSGRWLGRYQEEQALQLPAWVFGSDDEEADAESLGLVL